MILDTSRFNSSHAGNRRTVRRRGVLLLIVLSLLVLFVLAGLSFIVVASQFKKSSIPGTRVERTETDPETLINEVKSQLLTGPNRPGSALLGHSLLEDLYGRDYSLGTLTAPVVYTSSEQLLTTQFNATAMVPSPTLNGIPTSDFYNGCVFTIISGANAGSSTRVISYRIVGSNVELVLEPFAGLSQTQLTHLINQRFLINGRPFNGAGAGFLPADPGNGIVASADSVFFDSDGTPDVDALLNLPIALLPNFGSYLPYFDGSPISAAPDAGGLDESYDAVDFQNMALAYMPFDPLIDNIVPSFHRPWLLDYWNEYHLNHPTSQQPIPDAVLRAVSMRPNWRDHPFFTGSNPALDISTADDATLVDRMILGVADIDGDMTPDRSTWDIDNDGDGIHDSVWIDAGLPTEMTADGRTYKPLVAILCVDLDGRINVNVHGNQLDPGVHPLTPTITYPLAPGQPISTTTQLQGGGFGPAEVSPADGAIAGADWLKLRNARYRGPSDAAGLPGLAYNPAYPVNTDDLANFPFKLLDIPNDYAGELGCYQSPADIHGRSVVAIDNLGQPIWSNVFDADQRLDHPYELNVNSPQASDGIFTVSELEGLLRPYDFDISMLPRRLAELLPTTIAANPHIGRLITTRSFDIPTPNVEIPTAFHGVDLSNGGQLGSSASIRDLFDARFFEAIGGGATINIDQEVDKTLAFELRKGEKLDINRYFGDCQDNNTDPTEPGYGVVDEYSEIGEMLADVNLNWHTGTLLNFDATVPAHIPNPAIAPYRQTMARHLFCLMMFLRDRNNGIDFGRNGVIDANETVTSIAQWAVNVIDFRDADSIMTPFEYDLNPYDGWDVDGDLTTNENSTIPNSRGVVWGVERPELLITEALAWHERRMEDRDDDDGVGLPKPVDPTDDQRLRPQGRFFVELYNPWFDSRQDDPTKVGAKAPAELYDLDAATGTVRGVNLNKVVDVAGARSPVWRLHVVKPPNIPFNANREIRYVYFVGAADGITSPNITRKSTRERSYSTSLHSATEPIVVAPGRYAVIGSGGRQMAGGFVSPIGFRTDVDFYGSDYDNNNPNVNGFAVGLITKMPTTRRIVLTPSSDPNIDQVAVLESMHNNDNFQDPTANFYPPQPDSQDIQPAVAVVIDQPWPLSVSEPIEGYPATNATIGSEPAYDPPQDLPLDDGRFAGSADGQMSEQNYCKVNLQRLADPTRTYNLTTNPYLTIDTSLVDLTVFNGIAFNATNNTTTASSGVHFYANQRGDESRIGPFAGMDEPRVLWRSETDPNTLRNLAGGSITPQTETNAGGRIHQFEFLLRTSLGYLNHGYQPSFTAFDEASNAYQYRGSPAPDDDVPSRGGIRQGTFPWLVWNNRPFASPLELLHVTWCSAEELGQQFDVPHFNLAGALLPFDDFVSQPAVTGTGVTPRSSMPHLMPFFAEGSELYRIFDYVGFPSRFLGTSKWFNATSIAADPFAMRLEPPFSRFSRFREPGRVNLNTIPGAAVWNSLTKRQGPTWTQFDTAIRRWPVGAPSQFVPFRGASGANLMPTLYSDYSTLSGQNDALKLSGAMAGMARKFSAADFTEQPMFNRIPFVTHLNGYRNTQFRFDIAARMSNIATTHSNVYAVWITLGYFEATPNSAVPGGFELRGELGADTGEIERHRAFYIIDRSIPVGYEPGKKHNADDTIVLRRFIE